MSSCLSGGGPAYGFDLDIVKSSSSSSSSSSSARSSSPSSTLSESSNSPVTISIKKPRAPRKRPNQTYNEAAALLSTVYPKIFSTKNLVKISKQTIPFDGFHESSELLPPIPVLSDAAFLIREPSPEKPSLRIKSKATNSLDDKSSPISPNLVSNESSSPALSTVSNEMWEPNSPDPLEDDFDAQSILDEKVEEGIDSIMGNLCMSTNSTTNSNEDSLLCNSITNPYIQNLMGLGLGSELYLGLRFRYRGVMLQALKHRDDGCCWSSPTVPMKDILPKFKVPTPPSDKKKKKKKKAKKEEVVDMPSSATASTTQAQGRTKAGLGLKLNHDEILKAWSDHGSMFADGAESSNYSADALAKLANIDLSPENGAVGGVREACVMRYKEKRRTRLFSKKIRYQVRKVNADQRPRMKASGRFVKRPSLIQEAIDEESP